MSSNLKLIAQDEEQLTIISSLTQDSIVKTNEMGYDNKTKRFALLMNRYRHEEEDPSRIRCAIHFDYADTVKSIGIEKQSNDDILVLLAIRFESKVKPSGSIFLEFSNNKSITIDVESIEAFLTDMGDSWKIANKPVHEED
jgi:hypothetical protein|tara:strand:+ start:566 stop:988 length:423 start_codon:yes stop_codon:yes gene_type:complete